MTTIGNSSATIQEIECKWQVHSTGDVRRLRDALVACGARFSRPGSVDIRDHYLDTPDHHFRRARALCRLRCRNGAWELTLKSMRPPRHGTFIRKERTFRIDDAVTEAEALDVIHAEVLADELDERRLQLILGIVNRRTMHPLRLDDGTEACLCIDDARALAGGKSRSFFEAELELRHGDARVFRALVDEMRTLLDLTPGIASKFASSAREFGLAGETPDAPEYSFTSEDSIGDAVRQVMHRRLEIIRLARPAARLGIDDSAIDELYAATTGLHTAMTVFAKALPGSARRHAGQLRHLGRSIDQCRDLEQRLGIVRLLAPRLGDDRQEHLRRYCTILEHRFETASRKMNDALDSSGQERLMTSLRAIAAPTTAKPDKGGRTERDAVREAARKDVRKAARKAVRKAARKAIERGVDRLIERYPRRIHDVRDAPLGELRLELERTCEVCRFFAHLGTPDLDTFLDRTRKVRRALDGHRAADLGVEMIEADRLTLRLGAAGDRDRRHEPEAMLDMLADLCTELKKDRAALGARFIADWSDYRRRKRLRSLTANPLRDSSGKKKQRRSR